MKRRRHTNNTGERQIREGRTREQIKRIAARLGVPTEEKMIEFETCLYCNSEIDTSHVTLAPIDDDETWELIAQEHADDCYWVATRSRLTDEDPVVYPSGNWRKG